MSMTVDEIREHADRLEGRLVAERRKVEAGDYTGPRSANLRLIEGLEGRIKELRAQCDAVAAGAAAVPA